MRRDNDISINSGKALGFAIPPFIPFRNIVIAGTKEYKEITGQISNAGNRTSEDAPAELISRLNSGLVERTSFQVPVTLTMNDDNGDLSLRLPCDPIISLSGKNIIIRRYVSKSKKAGSIKERWSQDDWEINIQGILSGDDAESTGELCRQLRELCENGKNGLAITCDFLNNYMGIWRIAVESFEFPFTKGLVDQNFSIKAYSDDVYDLLIEQNV
jgi:hypothetical protein